MQKPIKIRLEDKPLSFNLTGEAVELERVIEAALDGENVMNVIFATENDSLVLTKNPEL
jgi:hypothetical protein